MNDRIRYEEKLRVRRKRVILLNRAHRHSPGRDVETERVGDGYLGIDGRCMLAGNANPTDEGVEELDSDERVKPHSRTLETRVLQSAEFSALPKSIQKSK